MKRGAMRKNSKEGLPSDPLWYKDAIIYEVRVRSYYDQNGDGLGDLAGLAEKLDYLQDLGVTALWLLPLCPSPLRDDGYDISDYYDVHPEVGTLNDFKRFLEEAHRRGLRVITELVLNHTSDQHPWFQRARRAPPGSSHRNFYVWSDTPERYKEARIIFKDFEPSNWSWDPVAKAYFWHRFYAHQPDLNFENPEVQEELFRVVDFWFELGVDGLRLDAVPYLYEAEGTNGENLPETHEFLKKLRAHIDTKFTGRMLLAEANQWPEDAAAYYGDGDECHMNFHFPLMPRIFMSIHMEDRFPLIDILAQTPPLAPNCQWALFLRNHDELTLEMVTDEERDYMYKAYANEQTMRINLGIRRRLAPLVENDRRKMELMNALLFSLPGTPVIYYGDEIGMGDNVYLGDRNGVRTPMQWSADRNAGFSRANPQKLILPIIIDPEYHYESIHVEAQQNNPNSLLWWMKRAIGLRKKYKAFGRGTMELLNPDNPRVFAFVRNYENESILVVANLSRLMQYAELDLSKWKGFRPVELAGRTELPVIGDAPYLLTLGGHAFFWFSLERPSTAEQDEREAAYQPPTIEVMGAWPSVLRGDDAAALEATLPDYLAVRRWFAGRGRAINAVTILDALPVGEESTSMHVVVVRVEYAEGEPERYILPLAFASEERAAELRARAPQAVLATVRAHPRGEAVNGVLFDALAEPPCCRALLNAMLERRRIKGSVGEIVGGIERDIDDSGSVEPRVISQAHESAAIVYGDKFILKLFRRMDEGTSPDLEVGRFLTKSAGSPAVAPLMGSMEYRASRDEPVTVATLLGYVPNEVTAWEFTREEVSRYFSRVLARNRDEAPPPRPSGSLLDLADQKVPQDVEGMIGTYLDLARLLGRRTGELHMALASDTADPAFAPEPISALYQRSKYQSMRNLTGRVIRQLRTRLPKLPASVRPMAEGLLAREDKLLKRFEGLLRAKLTGARIRCHGNLHLGQVLYTGKDFVIIDFEGDRDKPLSERRRKRLSLRDVAGVLRSFHYAAFTALIDDTVVRPEDRPIAEPWAHAWTLWVSAVYLRAYLDATKGAEFLPTSREEFSIVLDSTMLEKALSELGHELKSKGPWVSVPLQGIAQALDAEVAPSE